jgi:hypothetical protein
MQHKSNFRICVQTLKKIFPPIKYCLFSELQKPSFIEKTCRQVKHRFFRQNWFFVSNRRVCNNNENSLEYQICRV